jgi:hypothetical protein
MKKQMLYTAIECLVRIFSGANNISINILVGHFAQDVFRLQLISAKGFNRSLRYIKQ